MVPTPERNEGGNEEDAAASVTRPDAKSEVEGGAADFKRRAGELLVGIASRGPLVALAFLVLAATITLSRLPKNVCRMTYMRPSFNPVEVPHGSWGTRRGYSLWLYREGRPTPADLEVDGTPVLFIPGNAGDYKQVRSLGVQSHKDWQEQLHLDSNATRLDLWAVDFQEELSALSGATLAAQTRFVCKAIPFILSQYSEARGGGGSSGKILLVGHSMGGLVARMTLTEEACDLGVARVMGIVTVTTPHLRLPAVVDPVMRALMDRSEGRWREALFKKAEQERTQEQERYEATMRGKRSKGSGKGSNLEEAVLVNVLGGPRDILVSSELGDLADMCPPTHCFSLSSSSLAGAWLSSDHQAAVWCNQIVEQLSSALHAIAKEEPAHGAEEDIGPFPLVARPPSRFQRVQNVLLRGPLTLETTSWMPRHPSLASAPLHHLLLPDLNPKPLPPYPVQLVPQKGLNRHLRLPDIKAGVRYLWPVPVIRSVDGVAPTLSFVSNLPLDSGWRLVLCSAKTDQSGQAPDAIAADCLTEFGEAPRDTDLWSVVKTAAGGTEVTGLAVPFRLQACTHRANADCAPDAEQGAGIQWLLTIAGRELRVGQFICFVSPPNLPPARAGGFWLSATLLQASAVEDYMEWLVVPQEPVNPSMKGAEYMPMVTLPLSLTPLPATLTLAFEGCLGNITPLHDPYVLQSPAVHWQDGLAEGTATSALPPGVPLPVWRHQRTPPFVTRWKANVAVMVDPHCRYSATIQADLLAWIGDGMRRHGVRIFALAAGTLCFASALSNPASAPAGPLAVDFQPYLMVLVALLLQPLLYCLFLAECSRCGSVWGCFMGTAVVQEMVHEARSADAKAVPAQIEWSHRESLSLPLLLALGAAGLGALLSGAFALLAPATPRRAPTPPTPPGLARVAALMAIAGVLGAVHAALGAAAALLLLASSPHVRDMGAAGTQVLALVLLGVLSRGPNLVSAAKNMATAFTTGGSVQQVWMEEVWGPRSSAWGWRGAIDSGLSLSFPLLAVATVAALASAAAKQKDPPPPAPPRLAIKVLFVLAGLLAVYGAQVDIYLLLWVAFAATAILCLGALAPPREPGPPKAKNA